MNSNQMVVEWYLTEQGSISLFKAFLAGGRVRYGQAFFNVLSEEDQEKIRGTVWDTFYKEEPFDCALAITNVLTV